MTRKSKKKTEATNMRYYVLRSEGGRIGTIIEGFDTEEELLKKVDETKHIGGARQLICIHGTRYDVVEGVGPAKLVEIV